MEREYRPDGEQFAESTGSDLARNAPMPPIAANLVRLMEQAREERQRQGYTEFYPHWWMYTKSYEVVAEYSPAWRRRVQSEGFQRFAQNAGINIEDINLRSEISDEELEARQQFFRDIFTAYGIAAYQEFTPRQKDRFREILREDITEFNIGNVTLNEQQRELLTHIGIATSTPIDPDQETYHYYTVLTQPDITEEEMKQDPRYDT
jgi:hypothetical protein